MLIEIDKIREFLRLEADGKHAYNVNALIHTYIAWRKSKQVDCLSEIYSTMGLDADTGHCPTTLEQMQQLFHFVSKLVEGSEVLRSHYAKEAMGGVEVEFWLLQAEKDLKVLREFKDLLHEAIRVNSVVEPISSGAASSGEAASRGEAFEEATSFRAREEGKEGDKGAEQDSALCPVTTVDHPVVSGGASGGFGIPESIPTEGSTSAKQLEEIDIALNDREAQRGGAMVPLNRVPNNDCAEMHHSSTPDHEAADADSLRPDQEQSSRNWVERCTDSRGKGRWCSIM